MLGFCRIKSAAAYCEVNQKAMPEHNRERARLIKKSFSRAGLSLAEVGESPWFGILSRVAFAQKIINKRLELSNKAMDRVLAKIIQKGSRLKLFIMSPAPKHSPAAAHLI